jgi:hypothetical protein
MATSHKSPASVGTAVYSSTTERINVSASALRTVTLHLKGLG